MKNKTVIPENTVDLLKDSWAVKNDGSPEFQQVIGWMNIAPFENKILTFNADLDRGYFFGHLQEQNYLNLWRLPQDGQNILTISDFLASLANSEGETKHGGKGKPLKAKPIFYATAFPFLQGIAKDMGYNLLIHGSLNTDMDLVAVPWIDKPKTHLELLSSFCDCLGVCEPYKPNNETDYLHTILPGGRNSYVINLNRGGKWNGYKDEKYYLDISFTPTIAAGYTLSKESPDDSTFEWMKTPEMKEKLKKCNYSVRPFTPKHIKDLANEMYGDSSDMDILLRKLGFADGYGACQETLKESPMVSLEDMFRFAEWLKDECTVDSYHVGPDFEKEISEYRYNGTTYEAISELYTIFQNENKQ